MEKKEKTARFTIDIPNNDHKRLKALAALKGKSMRELVMQSIKSQLRQLESTAKKDFLKNGL